MIYANERLSRKKSRCFEEVESQKMRSRPTQMKASDKQFGKLAPAGFIEATLTLIARPVCNLVMERLDNESVSGFRKL